ncbi:MAG: ASCH domain-containing protein [Maribacter sp.]
MRLLTLLLFVILMSCKGEKKAETKTEAETQVDAEIENENGIDQSVANMWNDFTEANPEFRNEELPDADSFHNNEADAKRLADLIVSGKKQAGSMLYFFFKEAKADLPTIGTKSIVTNFDGKARAIIQTTKVDTIPFSQISEAYAVLDMGTDIEPLKKWKKAHWDFFAPAMEQNGKKPTEEMLIVCTWFETIWPEKD